MKKEKSSIEKYAEKYLKERGYSVELIKAYNSKTIYLISKNGYSENIEIPYAVDKKKSYMDMINDAFNMKLEIIKLKGELK